VLCGIIRLSEQFERSRDRSIAALTVERNGEGVSLRAQTNGANDARVAIWAAQRNADLLAEAIGDSVEVVVA
jgi:hypothetical protein